MSEHSSKNLILKKIEYIFVLLVIFAWAFSYLPMTSVEAATSPVLYPASDGNYDSWADGTTDCVAGDCYVEVDSENGAECAGGRDGNGSDSTTYISSSTVDQRQTFDINLATIPDGAQISAIDVYGCMRQQNATADARFFVRVDGVDTDGATTHSMNKVYTEYNENISVTHTKAAGSDIEIGTFPDNAKERWITEMWAVITYTTPGNTLPIASSVSIDSGAAAVDLTENTTTVVSCTATVTDNNGFANITSVKAELHRSGVIPGSGDENKDHYTMEGDTECVPSNGSGTTEDYTCDFDVWYYADPTDAGGYSAQHWECLVTPYDSVGDGTTDVDTIEVNSLSALDVTSAISHGAMSLGTDSGASNQMVTITNTGNVNIDVNFSGSNMSCTIGSIPAGNQKYDTLDVTYASLANTLTGTPVELDIDINQRINDVTPSYTNTYWGLALPSTGIGGTCTGLNTFSAVNDINKD